EQIAAEGHDAADAHGVAVDGADERLGKVAEDFEGAAAALGDALDEVGRRRHRVRARILEVRAGRERAARVVARQDRAADLVVVLHGGEVAREALVEIGAPRVARLGTAQGDDADGSAPLERDGHAGLLPPRVSLEPPVPVAALWLSTDAG